MFDITLPPTMTGNIEKAAGELVKLARELRGPTFCLLAIAAAWVGCKAFVVVHQELYGTATVKHDVVHRNVSST